MSLLEPEKYFSRVSAISIERDIFGQGFSYVLLDLDNTILSRATHSVPFDVMRWIAEAKRAGIAIGLVSNNWHTAPFETADALSIPVVAKALKPLPLGFETALRKIGGSRDTAVVVGDQASTDVLGAHLAGLAAYLVAPLVEEGEPLRTRWARTIERTIAPVPEARDRREACTEKDRSCKPVH